MKLLNELYYFYKNIRKKNEWWIKKDCKIFHALAVFFRKWLKNSIASAASHTGFRSNESLRDLEQKQFSLMHLPFIGQQEQFIFQAMDAFTIHYSTLSFFQNGLCRFFISIKFGI